MANLSGTLGTSTVDLVGTKRWLLESVHYSDSVYIYIYIYIFMSMLYDMM